MNKTIEQQRKDILNIIEQNSAVQNISLKAIDKIIEYYGGEEKGMRWVKASERLPGKGKMVFGRVDGHLMMVLVNSVVDNKIHEASTLAPFLQYDYSKIEWLDESPNDQEQKGEATDMTVQEFYSGFNLDFMTEEERQTIYTATELYAKGKLRVASLPDQEQGKEAECWEEVEEIVDEWNNEKMQELKEVIQNLQSKFTITRKQ